MKKAAFFCIPAHGHTNPMLPVARELVRRGDRVRFYSFEEFRPKIEATGAEFAACDEFLPKIDQKQEARLKKVSTTEMTIQDIRITANMSGFLDKEIREFAPDVIYTDSVCFWGKLIAQKYDIPMVVSTSTFAFNRLSSQYMKQSAGEMAGLIFGMPKMSRELKKLRKYGYPTRGILALVQSDNETDSVVYASRGFQPYAQTFSGHYAFVGPSLACDTAPNKAKERPLVYISMGTVINDRPDFYKNCIAALKNENVDVVISCGSYMDKAALGEIPGNVRVYERVDQLAVLARADAFITHCGMNSVSESIYMATPMVLYPQTSEQRAVARRAAELGTGVTLKDDSAAGIAKAVRKVLNDPTYAAAAQVSGEEFRACGGAAAAADHIEAAPHENAPDSAVLNEISKKAGRWQRLYWAAAALLLAAVGCLAGWKYIWIVAVPAGNLAAPWGKWVTKRQADKLLGPMRG